MNYLEKYFYANTGRVIHKFAHYFEIYECHLEKFRKKNITVVEIGVGDGGSLLMWKNYFGPLAKVYGIDVSTSGFINDDPSIKCLQGDQSNEEFLQSVIQRIGSIDVLIDDGSHRSRDQITTLKTLFPIISEEGVYICEDMQTSYYEKYGGGYRKPGSFVEYVKTLIDELNAWARNDDDEDFQKTEFTRHAYGIFFYCYMVVIEKRYMDKILRSPVMTGGVHAQ